MQCYDRGRYFLHPHVREGVRIGLVLCIAADIAAALRAALCLARGTRTSGSCQNLAPNDTPQVVGEFQTDPMPSVLDSTWVR